IQLGVFGHQRAANKTRERDRQLRSIHRWFDHFLRGRRGSPRTGVTAFAQTCPKDAPPKGPFQAPTFAGLARGEIRLRGPEPRTVSSNGLDPAGGAALDPVAGMGDGCAAVSKTEPAGTATYSREVTRPKGVTVIGSPAITAKIAISGAAPADAEVAARLFDLGPDGDKRRLVARGLYRPDAKPRQAWQLHPAAWKFEAGHTIELQLLGADPPYSRPSNSSFEIEVARLKLRLPVRQRPDSKSIRRPSPPVLLPGQRPAP
ncbi:MAG: CocE/NonD family hydrolase C-terminal non-catalytic domain-containing protein, partial [Vicinamibacteria bacterium]